MKQRFTSIVYWLWRQTEQTSTRKAIKIIVGLSLLAVGLPLVANVTGRLAYRLSSYDAAQRIWRINQVVAWYDRDIPAYNTATAYYRLANWTASIDQLERALKQAPESRQCEVRWNLALALNQRGDERAGSQQENAAVGDYTRAVSLLGYPACAEKPAFSELREVIDRKLASLIERINQQNSRPQSTIPSQENEPQKSDDEEAAEQAKRQREYRNSINGNRYNEQTDEQKEQGYQNKAW